MKKIREDHTNKIYNSLTCIRFSRIDDIKRTMWICRCACGIEREFWINSVKRNKTKSCGCMKSQYIRKSKQYEYGEASFMFLVRRLKRGAMLRKIEFTLTEDDIRKLSKQNCFYCGIEPSTISKTQNYTGTYTYNGIDRIDSNKGYTLENSITSCKYCNFAKNDLSIDDFKLHIKKIFNHFVKE